MKLPGLTYASPKVFTRKQRFVLCAGSWLIASAAKALVGPGKFEVRGEEHLAAVRARTGGEAIGGFWHAGAVLALAQYRNTNFHTMSSYSFDGELGARVVARFGCESVRGSSSRGSVKALGEMEKALHLAKAVGFALDGPRGPRRIAKPGAAMLAARTGTPILPTAFAMAGGWRLNTWDRTLVPSPFARVLCVYGAPVEAPANASRGCVMETSRRLQRELNALHAGLDAELGNAVEVEVDMEAGGR